MLIFLDFDGVIHGNPAGERGLFYYAPRIDNLLRRMPFVSIVISSSWRETYPLDVILEIFAVEVRHRIVGITPVLIGATRYDEIQSWIESNNYVGPWIALDDDMREFPAECPNLVLCNTRIGLDEAAERKLYSAIAERMQG